MLRLEMPGSCVSLLIKDFSLFIIDFIAIVFLQSCVEELQKVDKVPAIVPTLVQTPLFELQGAVISVLFSILATSIKATEFSIFCKMHNKNANHGDTNIDYARCLGGFPFISEDAILC